MSQEDTASMAQSRPSHEWVMLRGIGLWILYGPSQLNIMWENGSSLIGDSTRSGLPHNPGQGGIRAW